MTKRPPFGWPFAFDAMRYVGSAELLQIAAEALDAAADLFEVCRLGGV